MIEIRPMRVGDLDVVEEMGNSCYPSNYHESVGSKVSSGCCLVGLVDGVLAGYLVGFPYVLGVSDRAGPKRISRYRSAPLRLPPVVQRRRPGL